MIIQNNMMAANLNRNLSTTNNNLKKSVKGLSTGFSINSAADNAAKLSISEKMRSQIRGLNQTSANIGDGISYIQVADGALSEVQSILQRMNVLAVKGANDTYTELDRMAIDEEIQELKEEISRIFTDTEFNTKRIWEDNPESRIQIGVEKLPAITMNSNSTTGTINEINKEALPNNGRYTLLADENGITVKWDAYNGNTYSSNIIDWPETLKGNQSFKLSDYIDIDVDTGINTELSGLDFTFTYNVIEAATLDDVIASINGTYVYCSPYNSVGTRVYSDDGSSIPGISFSSSISYRALLASEKNMDTYDDLFIEGSAGGVLNENNLILDPTDTSSADKWVFEFQMPNIGTVKATSTSTIYYSYWRDPNKNWWNTDSYGNIYIKTYSPTPNNGSLDSVINSLVNPGLDLLNDTDDTGGYVEVSFNLIADSPYSLKDGSTQTNVGSMTMQIRVTPDDTIEKIKDKLSKIRGIDIYAGNNSTNAPSNTYYYAREDQKKGLLIDSPVYQSVIELNIQSGANENQAIKLIYKSLNNHSLGINNANALTREASENAISQVANALSIVSEQRSLFGAYQNRLEHARYNVDNMAENTQAAESKMRDTDMAKEMVEYAKQQILQQANHSLLSQANQISERVLVLLK